MNFFSASCTDIGKKRKLNEDAVLDAAPNAVWAVADGMGGHEAGDVASARIVEALGALAVSADLHTDADHACQALESVNDELLDLARSSGDPKRTIGSTVAALLIRGSRYCCIWAGDSRAYLVRDRQITQLSTDHSLVNDLVKSGLISAEEAKTHPDANVITRAVGASKELQLDRHVDTVQAGDIFVLTTDGVNRVMADEELCTVVSTRNPRQAVDAVRDHVLANGAPDNLSIVIVRIP